MSDTMMLMAAALGAELVLLLMVLLVVSWMAHRAQRKRDAKAVKALVSRIKKAKPEREAAIETFLTDGMGLSGEAMSAHKVAMLRAELKLLQRFAGVYKKRDAGAAVRLDLDVVEAIAPYHALVGGEVSAESAAEPVDRSELEELRKENQRLSDELKITMETMSRMLNEYSTMFAGGSPADIAPIAASSAAVAAAVTGGQDKAAPDDDIAIVDAEPALSRSDVVAEVDDALEDLGDSVDNEVADGEDDAAQNPAADGSDLPEEKGAAMAGVAESNGLEDASAIVDDPGDVLVELDAADDDELSVAAEVASGNEGQDEVDPDDILAAFDAADDAESPVAAEMAPEAEVQDEADPDDIFAALDEPGGEASPGDVPIESAPEGESFAEEPAVGGVEGAAELGDSEIDAEAVFVEVAADPDKGEDVEPVAELLEEGAVAVMNAEEAVVAEDVAIEESDDLFDAAAIGDDLDEAALSDAEIDDLFDAVAPEPQKKESAS